MTADDLLFITVGSAAADIAGRMAEKISVPMRILVLDTDDTTLQRVPPRPGLSTWIFGVKRLNGRGTGGDRNLGASALRDDAAALQTQIGSPRLTLLLTCGGGGTSGALPQLLRLLKEQGATTLTFATEPFAFEGNERMRNTMALFSSIENETDALARIPLESLLNEASKEAPIEEAFDAIAQRLAAGIGLFWTLLTHPAFIAFDADHFYQYLESNPLSGAPLFFADTTCTGADRASYAVQEIIASPRFQHEGIDRLANASRIVVGVLAGDDLRLNELSTLMEGIRAHAPHAEVTLGTSFEVMREGSLGVVVLAFSKSPTAYHGGGGVLSPRAARKGEKASKGVQLGANKDRFADVEHTIYNGQDLDKPTFQRRNIRLQR